MSLAGRLARPLYALLVAIAIALGFTAYQAVAPEDSKMVTLTVPKADAATYIDIKNSVNSDAKIRAGNTYSNDFHTLYQGDHWNVWDADGGARIYVYFLDASIDSYQYFYDGVWHSCHKSIDSNWTNPAAVSSVTIRTFYSANCDGRN